MLLPQLSETRAVSLAAPLAVATGFVPGTQIWTEDGALPVEHLFAGDRVAVMGGGFATLRAVTRLRALGAEVVVLPPGILPGLEAPLTLPAAHPVLLDDWRAQIVFGQTAVRSRAGVLAERPGARMERRPVQTLIRLDFDRPQTIRANGLWLGCGSARAIPGPARRNLH